MSRAAAGILFAVLPGAILAGALLAGGARWELAVIVGGGLAGFGFDVCMRGRNR